MYFLDLFSLHCFHYFKIYGIHLTILRDVLRVEYVCVTRGALCVHAMVRVCDVL